jgi:translation initiation factor IF-3
MRQPVRQPRTLVNKHKINSEVRFPLVRLVGEGEPVVMSSRDASLKATEEGLDLILINEKGDPPVVRIADYKKFLYDQDKAEKIRKKNSQKSELKEIQLGVTIGDHDMQTKAKKANELLLEGHKIKCVLLLKGRQRANPDRGEIVMLKFAEMLSSGLLEAMPKLDGWRWIAIYKPKKK